MSVKLLVKSAVNRGSEAAYGRFETRGRQTPRPTRTSLWLQLATIGAASTIFDEQVIEPAAAARPGVARLRAYVERFLGHVEDGVFPGGCFFVSAVSELDSHPGDPSALDRVRRAVEDRLDALAA